MWFDIKRTLCILLLIFLIDSGFTQTNEAPPDVAAAMLVKAIAFESNVSNQGEVTIFILDAPEVADELKNGIGKPIGKSILKSVDSGNTLPENAPSILYVGNETHLDSAIQYTREHKIPSVTGNPDMVKKGVSLGFGIGIDNKPKIWLNLSTSVKESLEWNPAILKIARTVK
ncbi:DUF4154 domain-containing protein [bacterium]|nr:DUF4154 domain-containing protein [bacterium]